MLILFPLCFQSKKQKIQPKISRNSVLLSLPIQLSPLAMVISARAAKWEKSERCPPRRRTILQNHRVRKCRADGKTTLS